MYLHSVKLYAVVVQGHEDHVHHDAEGDEQLRERIEHNDGKYLKIKDENYNHGQVFELKYPKSKQKQRIYGYGTQVFYRGKHFFSPDNFEYNM